MEWAGQAWDEHQLLFEALVDRNAEAAMQAAAGHIKARSSSFTELAEISPEHLFFGSAVRHATSSGATAASRQFMPMKGRSEEHTSELQALMCISYDVYCLKTKKSTKNKIK